jgi:hypothetical protein
MNIRAGLAGFATTVALLASQGARAENTAEKVAQVPSLSVICNVVHQKTGEVLETHYLPKTHYWDVLQKQCDREVDRYIAQNLEQVGLDDLVGRISVPEWSEEIVSK